LCIPVKAKSYVTGLVEFCIFEPVASTLSVESASNLFSTKMKLILAIGAGSFIGGICRYLLTQFIQARFLSTFPFGTLGVNIIGCLVIGLIYGLSDKGSLTQDWRLFLATGVCGGFTTFSAFSNETFLMLRNGQYAYAFIYVAASVVLGLLATFGGYSIIKLF